MTERFRFAIVVSKYHDVVTDRLQAGALAALASQKSIRAVYQMHKSLRVPEGNTDPARIANEDESCAGYFIKLSVDPKGRSYTMWVPPTGHRQRYATRGR